MKSLGNIGDRIESTGQEFDPVVHEISVMRQIILERVHPFDLLRELVSNAAAKEVGATEILIKYTVDDAGHVFEVTYNPVTHAATWSGDLAGNLGDQPLTDIAVDWSTGDVYVSTDFGVFVRRGHTNWRPAANGLPPVTVFGLTINVGSRVLYAATHGRGAWSLSLQ